MLVMPTLVYCYKQTNKQTKVSRAPRVEEKNQRKKKGGKSTYTEQSYIECREFNSLWNRDFKSSSK